MPLIDFDVNEPNVFLDRRNAGEITDPFDVLVWDQRDGSVLLFVESMWAFSETDDGDPDWSKSARYHERTSEKEMLVYAANVPDGQPIPTVPEMLERQAAIIVRPDGEVWRRTEPTPEANQ